MSFKDMVDSDNKLVFLNESEFAMKRTVMYDGKTYADIDIVLTGLKEQDRRQASSDHSQGLYLVSGTLFCRSSDMGDILPKKGMRMLINNRVGGGGYFREYYIAASSNDMGMLRIELEAIDD